MTLFEKNLDVDMFQPGIFSGTDNYRLKHIPDTVDLTWLKPEHLSDDVVIINQKGLIIHAKSANMIKQQESKISGINFIVSEVEIIPDPESPNKLIISVEILQEQEGYTTITTHARPGYNNDRDEIRDIILPNWLLNKAKIILKKHNKVRSP